MKHRKRHNIISIVIIISCVMTLFMPLSVIASEEQINNNEQIAEKTINDCICFNDGSSILNLDTEIRHFSLSEHITLIYSVSLNYDITEYEYYQENLSIVSMNINDNHQIIIDMVPINNCIDSKLKIEVFLDNGEKLVDSIYVINNEYGSFISPFSYDDAREYYFQYAINNNILTEEECAKIRNDILKEISHRYLNNSSNHFLVCP